MNVSTRGRDWLDRLQREYLSILVLLLSGALLGLAAWTMRGNRGFLNWAEQSALLNTLLICDTFVFATATGLTLLILHLSSLYYGEFRGLRYHRLLAFAMVMLAPLAFIGGYLALKPAVFTGICAEAAVVLSGLALLAAISCTVEATQLCRPRSRIGRLIGTIVAEYHYAGARNTACTLQGPMASPTALSLMKTLKRLAAGGDEGPVLFALDALASAALDAGEADDSRGTELAKSLVCDIVEAGAIGADARSQYLVRHTVDLLKGLAIDARAEVVAAVAFRGISYVYGSCMKYGDCFRVSTLNPWLTGVYAGLFDATGRQEALDRAIQMADGALAEKDQMTFEDRVRALYAAGQVYRRLAEFRRSEEKALVAISLLEQALKIDAASPMDQAFLSLEIGRAYAVLGTIKNPVKSFKKALACYDEASQTLTSGVSPWDAAQISSDSGYASALLADEYYRLKKYDEALASARAAIECYTAASRFFTGSRSGEKHGRLMSGAGLAHTVISEIYLRSRELDNALKHVYMALDCYAASLATIDETRAPEVHASLKVSMGIAHVSVAEICFREKRYEEAIGACDRAIAAYNEALKTYEGTGREKLAVQARKHLKQASDLYNSFMMIGACKAKPAGDAS